MNTKKEPILEHPWLKFAGIFKDDTLFDEMQAEMLAYRRELDYDLVQESDIALRDGTTQQSTSPRQK